MQSPSRTVAVIAASQSEADAAGARLCTLSPATHVHCVTQPRHLEGLTFDEVVAVGPVDAALVQAAHARLRRAPVETVVFDLDPLSFPTPGEWSIRSHTFANVDEAVADHRRLLVQRPGFDPSVPVVVTFVAAPDDLPDPPADSDGTVVVAFLGNGPRAEANARLIQSAPGLHAKTLRLAADVVDMSREARTTKEMQDAVDLGHRAVAVEMDALRRRHGARDDESLVEFVDRLADERQLAESDRDHWKANHADVVEKKRRGEDAKGVELAVRNAAIRTLRTALGSVRNEGSFVEHVVGLTRAFVLDAAEVAGIDAALAGTAAFAPSEADEKLAHAFKGLRDGILGPDRLVRGAVLDDVFALDVDVAGSMVAFGVAPNDGGAGVATVRISRENLRLALDALDGKVERASPRKTYARDIGDEALAAVAAGDTSITVAVDHTTTAADAFSLPTDGGENPHLPTEYRDRLVANVHGLGPDTATDEPETR